MLASFLTYAILSDIKMMTFAIILHVGYMKSMADQIHILICQTKCPNCPSFGPLLV